ncbi:MAG: Crp/Fnr family transcriptional regulator [Tissierellia bacterium]|nr:Crp/Fnr family transcriptional regulator [Tissierellia bacterium]
MDESCQCKHDLCTSKIQLFKKLPLKVQGEIVDDAKHFNAKKGTELIREGDHCDAIYVLREGKAKLNRYDYEGKEMIFDLRTDGNTIGEENFLQNKHFNYNVILLEDSRLCKISKNQLFQILSKNSELALSFLTLLSERLQDANERIRLLMEDNGLRRVIGFLIMGNSPGEREIITLSLEDIAGLTNLRRETVSRKLNELQEKKIIKRLGQKQIQILNRKKLWALFYES